MPLLLLFFLVSCETKTPAGIIPPSDMVDVLYDYHMAQAMADQATDSVAYRYRVYTEAVFRKYGIDQAQFDSSLVWYTRHSDQLYKIYEQVDRRYAEAGGGSNAEERKSSYTALSAQGDTANVWSGPTFYLLSSQGSNNRLYFSYPVDSAYHVGDRLMWHFYADWICREGEKAAQAVLALQLQNDSVVVTTQSVYGSGEQRIVAPLVSMPLKRVSGFVYVTDTWSPSFKVLQLSDISLVRMHVPQPSQPEAAPMAADTAARRVPTPASNDSLRSDSALSTSGKGLRGRRSHSGLRAPIPKRLTP